MDKDKFWGDFFYMDSLVTPKILKLVNMIFIIVLALICLVSLITGIVDSGFMGIFIFIGSVFVATITYVFIRIFLEISLILFRIEENTRDKKK